MTRVLPVNAFREQTFAPAFPPAGECRPATFGPHPGTETMLAFPCSFGWLVSAFHNVGPLRERYTRGTGRIVNAQPVRAFALAQPDYEEDDEDEINGTKTRCVYSWLG